MIKLIKHYFSLTRLEHRFNDNVSGKEVWLYRDCNDDYWLKDSRWSMFRVKANEHI